MKKILIWLAALMAGLVVLLIAAVIIIPRFIDVESYKPIIEKKVAEATGRSFSLGNDFKVSVFPWVGVSFSNLNLGNPAEYGGGDFVKVRSFEARIKLLPLLSKKIEIKKFVVDGPEIFLVKMADGKGNWTMGDGSAGSAAPEETKKEKSGEGKGSGDTDIGISSLEVGEFSVTNGKVVYQDNVTNKTSEIGELTFTLQDVSLDKPVGLFFDAVVDGNPISMEGSIGPIGQTPGKGTVKLDFVIQAMQQLKMSVKGEIVEPSTEQKFSFNVAVADFSPREIYKKLNIPFPAVTTDPAVLNNVSLDINIKGDPTNIIIDKSSLKLDDSQLAFSAEVKEMSKPNLSFSLDLDGINIDRYLPPPAEPGKSDEAQAAQTTQAASKGVSGSTPGGAVAQAAEPERIDYEPLRKLILSGDIRAGELIAHGAKVQNVQIKIMGRDGVFDLEPFRLDLYQGKVGLTGNFNVQGDRPVSKIALQMNTVQVGPLLKDSVEKDILEGAMSLATDITFTGDNGPDIKKSLNGSGKVDFTDGAIVGIDIAEMGRNLAAGLAYQKPAEKPRTDFAELRVPFTLVNGVFQTDDAFLSSPLLRLNALGTADLVSEKLNFKVRPKVVGTLKGQGDAEKRSGLTVPLLVEGTFSKPEYSADFSALASEETLKQAISDPEGTKKKIKDLEETGKSLLQGFGFGKKK